jgi:hypothetical protein
LNWSTRIKGSISISPIFKRNSDSLPIIEKKPSYSYAENN